MLAGLYKKIMFLKQYLKVLLSIFAIFFVFFLFPKPTQAQFSGELGTITGTVKWGTETATSKFRIKFVGNSTGYTTFRDTEGDGSYNTAFTLPPDTYTVSLYAFQAGAPDSLGYALGTQTVTVNSGQEALVNFDLSGITGFIKGELKINGLPVNGYVQFCGPQPTDPCPISLSGNPFDYHNGPWKEFPPFGFKESLPPGNYRVHVITTSRIDVGILPITVTTGEVLDLVTSSVSVPTGQNVTVHLAGITVTFPEVITSGFMTVTTTSNPQGGQPPSQYRFLGTYYELTTTATYTGPVTVSFTYNDADVRGREENLKLFHWDGTAWQNITVSVDTVNNIITGLSPTLSPFAIGESLNTPPTVRAGGPYNVNEGGLTQMTATGSDPENGPLTYAWDLDNNGSFETEGQNITFSATDLDGPAIRTIAVQVTDEGGLSATDQITVDVTNVAPTATFNATSPLDEGGVSNLSLANASDVAPDTSSGFHYSFACSGQDSLLASSYVTAGSESTVNCPFADNGNYIVKGRIFDKDNGFTSYEATVVVNNIAPTVGAITAPLDPNQVNTSVNTSANFTDAGTPDTHTAVWDWGDSTTSAGTVTETNGSGGVTGNHIYTTVGVYTIKLTVTDDDGGSGESMFQFVIIYDPNEGFVTGGGWIDSPSGAYTADTSLTGRANFGFVSKYQQGASVPTGQTEFQLKVASFNFHSTTYDWLVIAGPNAKYKGSGTVNDSGDYAFMLTAVDGQTIGGGGIDRFRIKIWNKSTNEVVYDNQMSDGDDANATDAIEAGSIVIHQ